MRRGEVWLAEVGRKPRPVIVLTRSEVLDVRALVTVAEVTSTARVGSLDEQTLRRVCSALSYALGC